MSIKINEGTVGDETVIFTFKSSEKISMWFSTSDGVEELFIHGYGKPITVSVHAKESGESGVNLLPVTNSVYLRIT